MTDIVAPPSVTAPPDAPLITDTIDDFNVKSFALAGWYETNVDEMEALAANTHNNATAANERAVAAAGSASNAATQVGLAAAQVALANTARTDAQGFAQSAVNAPGTSGTSVTSMAVGSGTKTFTTQTGKAWVVGQPVVISRSSAPTTVQMYGLISAYDGGTGSMSAVVPLDGVTGSGTYSDWTIALTGRRGQSGSLPVVPITSNTTAVAGVMYRFDAACTLIAPPLGGDNEEFGFINATGGTSCAVDFGSTKVTTATGIKTPGVMTIDRPYVGCRLRSTGNATTGYMPT